MVEGSCSGVGSSRSLSFFSLTDTSLSLSSPYATFDFLGYTH